MRNLFKSENICCCLILGSWFSFTNSRCLRRSWIYPSSFLDWIDGKQIVVSKKDDIKSMYVPLRWRDRRSFCRSWITASHLSKTFLLRSISRASSLRSVESISTLRSLYRPCRPHLLAFSLLSPTSSSRFRFSGSLDHTPPSSFSKWPLHSNQQEIVSLSSLYYWGSLPTSKFLLISFYSSACSFRNTALSFFRLLYLVVS